MKIIVAGSRSITDYELVKRVIFEVLAKYNIMSLQLVEIVSGHAPGVDLLGERWADENQVKKTLFPATWDDLITLPVKIKTNKFGKKYNALAGFNRNGKMADYADILIAFWDGKSPGTKDMLNCMVDRNKTFWLYDTSINKLNVWYEGKERWKTSENS